MKEEKLNLMTFQTVTNGVILDRYNRNHGVLVNIDGNHISWNINAANNGTWHWSYNLSAFLTNNKEFIYVPAGSTVTLTLIATQDNPGTGNQSFLLYPSTTPNNPIDPPSGGICKVNQPTTKGSTKSASETVTTGGYYYFSHFITPNPVLEFDVKIYIDGKRVV